METLTESQIERRVELAIDRLDRHLLSNQITQEQYDRDIVAIDKWAEQQYRLIAAAPDMLDLLYIVLPYIEDAENDPAYKAGAVAKITKQIRATIAKAEGN